MQSRIEEEIKRHLSASMLIEFNEDVDVNTDLFQVGLMDSMGYINLVSFIESNFGVKFTDEELLSGVAVSVAGFVDLLESKKFL